LVRPGTDALPRLASRCDHGAVAAVPDFVTHYYLPDRQPFLNLGDLDEERLTVVLHELAELRQSGQQHRPFGPRYMALRRLTEQRLHRLFVAAGGRPERRSPHYFVLGESRWYERLAPVMKAVRVPLSALPADRTSFTYPDSFTSMGCGQDFGLKQTPKPYHGRVFLRHELDALVGDHGVPDPPSDATEGTWREWPEDVYIEVQLWADTPIRQHLPA